MLKWLIGVVLLVVVGIIIYINKPPPGGYFKPEAITLTEQGEYKILVDAQLKFIDANKEVWTAPKGTLTDGATVPRLVLPVTDGRWHPGFLKAAVVHDAYCQEENAERTPHQYQSRSWRDVHRMFFEACIVGGTDPSIAKLMYAAVFFGGPRWGDPKHELTELPAEMLVRGFSGTKEWIQEKNPSVEEIEAYFDKREPVLKRLYRLETDVNSAISRGDINEARRLIGNQEAVIKKQIEKSPNDSMLQIFNGHLYKNRAEIYRIERIEEKANEDLIRSEAIFEKVIETQPRDPSALAGLSYVSMKRGDLERAEVLAREAITVAPEYETAKKDLKRIEDLRIERRR